MADAPAEFSLPSARALAHCRAPTHPLLEPQILSQGPIPSWTPRSLAEYLPLLLAPGHFLHVLPLFSNRISVPVPNPPLLSEAAFPHGALLPARISGTRPCSPACVNWQAVASTLQPSLGLCINPVSPQDPPHSLCSTLGGTGDGGTHRCPSGLDSGQRPAALAAQLDSWAGRSWRLLLLLG